MRNADFGLWNKQKRHGERENGREEKAGLFSFVFVFFKYDGVVKSPVFVIARSSANAGRRSNPVFSRTYKNEIASSASGGLAMTLLPTFYEIIQYTWLKSMGG
jgi:hypothetical protein